MNSKKNVLLTTSAAPSQTPFSTSEKRPPLGIGCLISVLRNAGHEVFFIDNYLRPSNFLETDYLSQNTIDYVGIYANTICYRDTLRMLYKLEWLRRTDKWKGKIIVGGPHTTVCLETIPNFVDYVVQGEGEHAILDIVGGRVSERVVKYPRIKDLDELPMPAWDYFIHLPYNWSVDWFEEKPVFSMNTSRGCPFECTFCSVGAVWGKKYSYFSAERIVSDIEYLIKNYGAKGIYFREDNFTLHKNRLREFCNLIIARKINILWSCESRVDTLNREIVELMHRAGARGFYFGVENGSQRILDFLKKGITIEHIKNAFKLCHEFGIKTAASIVVGTPTETEKDIIQTVKLLEEIRPTVTWYNVFVGIPNSNLYQYVKEKKLYEFIDDRGLVYMKGHNDRVKKYYGNSWDAYIPANINNPSVSVVMSVYNGSKYLESSIKSVLSQTFQDFEFIIINDASTDNTEEILKRFNDPRIKIAANPENLGLTISLNKGISLSKGRYIARMDADDISHPLRFEKQVDYLDKNQQCITLGTWIGFIDDTGSIFNIWKTSKKSETIKKELLVSNAIGHGSAMIRSAALKRIGGYNEIFHYAQDYDLWLRLSEIGDLQNLPEELYYLRFWPNSISVSKKKIQDEYAALARREALRRSGQETGIAYSPLKKCSLSDSLKITVVLPTYNRPDILARCLEGFVQQTVPKSHFEVVVVDDGSSPPVRGVVENFLNKLNIIYHYQQNSGLAAARNLCIEKARAKLLSLHDDDDIPKHDYLERCILFHEKYPNKNDILLAQVVPHPKLERTPILEWMFDGSNGIIGFPDPQIIHDFWWFFGGTSSCKKSIFRSGMFDPEYRFGFEDTECAIRLNKRLPLRVHYDPMTVSYLLRAPDFPWMFKRSYLEGRSHHRVYNRHGNIILVGVGKDALNSAEIVKRIKSNLPEVLRRVKELECILTGEKNIFLNKEQRDILKNELRDNYFISRTYGRAKGWLDFEGKANKNGSLKEFEKIMTKHYFSPGILSKIKSDNIKKDSYQIPSCEYPAPVVSIVIPCYNYGHFLQETVNSVISQTFTDFEVIIVNDGSTDNTVEVTKKIISENPSHHIYLINQKNSGKPATARNCGISVAKGRYILCLDADDKIQPTMIEECVRLLDNNPEISIAYTDQIYFNEDSERNVQVLEYDFNFLLQSNFLGYCSMFRRGVWETSGGFPTDVGYEDWDFWITCGKKGYYGKRIPKSLFCYRDHKKGQYQRDLKMGSYIKARIVMKHGELYDKKIKKWARKICDKKAKAVKASKRPFRVVAIIAAHNEGDVIYHAIEDLIQQKVEVYLINHCSNDNTIQEASKWLGKGLIHIENFPRDSGFPDSNYYSYNWTHILQRKEQLASQIDADWFIHHDADEFRESPWIGLSLKEAIKVVDKMGYNAIDFELFNFRPGDHSFVPGTDVRKVLKYYEKAEWFDAKQIKAWKKLKVPVKLADTGGHEAIFKGIKVFPTKFILRHYPIRSQVHGLKKVFAERKKRFSEEERKAGWHIQYDKIKTMDHNFIYKKSDLTLYDGNIIRLKILSSNAQQIASSFQKKLVNDKSPLCQLVYKKVQCLVIGLWAKFKHNI